MSLFDSSSSGSSTARPRRTRAGLVWGVAALLFGLATLSEGGAVLFFDGEARRAAGHVVPFVLWFNFGAGFAYVVTGAGLALVRPWARVAAAAIALATVLVFLALGAHIVMGGAFERRTVMAMALRSAFWVAAAMTARRRSGTGDAPLR